VRTHGPSSLALVGHVRGTAVSLGELAGSLTGLGYER
jgi:hypothetical protein